MLEHLNLLWFSMLNADAGLHGWRLELGIAAAKYLILLVPLGLAGLWIGGQPLQREAAVRALAATAGALALNACIGLLWFHARPFAGGIGHSFLRHAPDSSFPSDHGTIMFTVALVLAGARAPAARRFGAALLPLAAVVAWARVFLGVHWPLDMIGALGVAIAVALLFRSTAVDGPCAALAESMATLYRRLLARPIARGWLRP
ncbi:phosphatase PAP2 family protein [Herbaspirillum sp. SJZ107]|uniref:phosphatase PAP2 family protein n=1 Tax=Herbaspirillum sp. SJZ107 TaxID=2572881 RepID=UPI001153F00B|nr:phosphatase PAP2 family protein [Herbaspirillum sp. SJZ107]TQK05633.1 undecaprenyl-diphosphatase [Herbaspirillum sp. SJZ107]